VLGGFTQVLQADPRILDTADAAIEVRLVALGSSSIDVEVVASYQGTDWAEFKVARQEILMKLIEVVERSGTAFAYPTQTLHIASAPGAPVDARA
jgi:MscS family membrane protein